MREKLEELAKMAAECGIRELAFRCGAEGYAALVGAGGRADVTLYDDGTAIEGARLRLGSVEFRAQNHPARDLTEAERATVNAAEEHRRTYTRAVTLDA